MADWEHDLRAELEKMGEAEARVRLSRGDFGMVGSYRSRFVNQWLRLQESERVAGKETRSISLAEEANSISRKADSTAAEALSSSRDALSTSRLASADARRANVIAILAMICSVVAMIIAAVIGLYK